jgi:hypothetical protein
MGLDHREHGHSKLDIADYDCHGKRSRHPDSGICPGCEHEHVEHIEQVVKYLVHNLEERERFGIFSHNEQQRYGDQHERRRHDDRHERRRPGNPSLPHCVPDLCRTGGRLSNSRDIGRTEED